MQNESLFNNSFTASYPSNASESLHELGTTDVRGTSYPVLVSPLLWQGLLSPFPSATTRDYVQLLPFDKHVVTDQLYPPSLEQYSLLRFSCFPKWLNSNFYMKTQPQYSSGQLTHFLLLSPHEDATNFTVPQEPVFHLGLLASLCRVLNALRLVLRTSNSVPYHRFYRVVKTKLHFHPLGVFLNHNSTDLHPLECTHLTRHEYRNHILADLDRLLQVICAIYPSKKTATLVRHFNSLRAPDADLLDIAESIISLTGRLDGRHTPNSPFRAALAAHFEITQALKACNPALLENLTHPLQHVLSYLLNNAPENWQEHLSELQQRLNALKALATAEQDEKLATQMVPPAALLN